MADCVENGQKESATSQFEAQAGFSLGGGWPRGLDYAEQAPQVPPGGPPDRPSRTALDDYKLKGNSQTLDTAFPPVDAWTPDEAAASAEEKVWLPYTEK